MRMIALIGVLILTGSTALAEPPPEGSRNVQFDATYVICDELEQTSNIFWAGERRRALGAMYQYVAYTETVNEQGEPVCSQKQVLATNVGRSEFLGEFKTLTLWDHFPPTWVVQVTYGDESRTGHFLYSEYEGEPLWHFADEN